MLRGNPFAHNLRPVTQRTRRPSPVSAVLPRPHHGPFVRAAHQAHTDASVLVPTTCPAPESCARCACITARPRPSLTLVSRCPPGTPTPYDSARAPSLHRSRHGHAQVWRARLGAASRSSPLETRTRPNLACASRSRITDSCPGPERRIRPSLAYTRHLNNKCYVPRRNCRITHHGTGVA